jgi:hypothetical protein
MINQTIYAVSLDETKPLYTGELIEMENDRLSIVALDNYRMAVRTEALEGQDAVKFVVPAKALKEIEHLLLLRRSQFAGFASGYAGSCRAVACEFRHVTGHVSVCSLCPIVERGIFPGRVIKVEEPRSDFIQMGSAVRKAYCRNTAVTGDESRHTLSYEGLKILFGVIFNGKPVVVGMPVYKARRYRLACHVNNSICRGRVDIGHDGNYAVILV